jgi:nicotinamide mononucleotide adenylyltransferase
MLNKVKFTIGRFQPFHRGHFRLLYPPADYDLAYIFVAGRQDGTKKNPFSFELRKRIIEESCKILGLEESIRVVNVFDLDEPGYLPSMIDYICQDTKVGTMQFSVGADRKMSFVQQIHRECEKNEYFATLVEKLHFKILDVPTLLNLDDNEVELLLKKMSTNEPVRYSGSVVREALMYSSKVQDIEDLMTIDFINSENKVLLYNQMMQAMHEAR